ncbi:DUF1499 domain-containing protein [Kamptonema animale CS-326]|jgi:uncharacterized protein (DUF1499 family)|uniref:DUF1499 domain-containing protein n=1 Tax=Kamptonema animale TaxID=92934 RepID=UPI00232B6E23|nr:DUF1499 domain-containing protein [Kamptonema animale]MDB9513598.1 DUF1499 domain-containing protein [Kamptonema animale CS-326]
MQKTETRSSLLNKVLVIIISLLVVTAIAIATTLAISGENTMFAGKRPTNLGVQSGQLAPCPNSPNCVSSFSQDNEHKISPLAYTSTSAEAISNLKKAILSLPKTQIITETNNYLYAEFTSALMGFVDDVEFLLDEESKVIQVRSASRLGQSDLGVNRKRIETLRAKLNQFST